jgi:hypothetical protein
MAANRLVLLCGAGLSIPDPSNLMSAVRVSQRCYDKYRPIAVLPPALRENVDQLAQHFHGTGEFESVFIGSLVPWDELVGDPNSGHAAVADFLISRAAHTALSANFDSLIEQWAGSRKIFLRGALNGQEAMEFRDKTSPLLKFHGCMIRGPNETLWTDAQLGDPSIRDRVTSCSDWMRLELPGKDLLIIGFWTDWGYLNDLLAEALRTVRFGSVTVVDMATSADLQLKAPRLWATLTGGTANFLHLRASSADSLEELQTAFSRAWLRQFYALGEPLVAAAGIAYAAMDPVMSSEDLYKSRCDAEGVPYNRAAQLKEPPAHGAEAAFLHHLLSQAGATRDGAWHRYGGQRVRVVQGAGQALNSVKERYKEPPASVQPDIVACAGARDLSTPGKLISSGSGLSVVRPGAGTGARWMTSQQARAELGI